jgi:putative acetyltransferase
MSDEATGRLAARLKEGALPGLVVRPAEDTDGHALTALVAAAYDEYACGPLDPEVFDADLAQPATSAAANARRWWVVLAVEGGEEPSLVASVAHGRAREDGDGAASVELHRLYLAPSVRGRGLATLLIEGMAEEARLAGASTLEAWSDTRLVDAHRRYLSSGFLLTGDRRELGDPAGTTELRFTLALRDLPTAPETPAGPAGR